MLNLDNPDALARGWEGLHADVGAHAPDLALDGVLVEAMGKRGVELIIGARNDADWGPVILVGFGGIHAELLKDVRLIAHDLTPDAVAAELRQLKSAALFDGFRSSPALDIEAVAELVCTLGAILAGTPQIREIDLNPVVVYPRGEGVVALDALILAG